MDINEVQIRVKEIENKAHKEWISLSSLRGI